MDSHEAQRRIEQLEREIAGLKAASSGAGAKVSQLEQELNSLKQEPEKHPSWQRVQLARHPKRPHAVDYIERLFPEFQDVHGDRGFGDDSAIVCGMAFLDGAPVMVVGQEKGHGQEFRNGGSIKPWGNANALYYMRVA
ncbi:MAG: acetyl-CoA carboxylase carboxyl transferase subunit alpha, partial [Acidobacteria bacterium]|nr:acetyl-CoA carboxylase carboxyl transferase subunit alpha [Acidobacteriota bacterium]